MPHLRLEKFNKRRAAYSSNYGIHVFHVLVHGTFCPDGFLLEPLARHEEYLNTTLISQGNIIISLHPGNEDRCMDNHLNLGEKKYNCFVKRRNRVKLRPYGQLVWAPVRLHVLQYMHAYTLLIINYSQLLLYRHLAVILRTPRRDNTDSS